MKILIIEDDQWFAESLAATINNSLTQINLKIAHDPEFAITIIDEWQPDLILLDMTLGTKNGLVLLHELQSYDDTRQIPVIIMSIDVRHLNLNDLQQFGVVNIINKTAITPDLLSSVISNATGKGSLDV